MISPAANARVIGVISSTRISKDVATAVWTSSQMSPTAVSTTSRLSTVLFLTSTRTASRSALRLCVFSPRNPRNLAKLRSPLLPLIIQALFPRLRHLLRELRSLPIATRLQLQAEAKLRPAKAKLASTTTAKSGQTSTNMAGPVATAESLALGGAALAAAFFAL